MQYKKHKKQAHSLIVIMLSKGLGAQLCIGVHKLDLKRNCSLGEFLYENRSCFNESTPVQLGLQSSLAPLHMGELWLAFFLGKKTDLVILNVVLPLLF